jgi:hypothetical protein
MFCVCAFSVCVCVLCVCVFSVCVCVCVCVCVYPQHHRNRLAVADKTGAGVAASRGPSAPGHSSATSGHQHTTTMRGGKEGYFASPSWESSVASGDDSGMTTVQSSPVALHPSPVALHQRATDLASILEVCTRYLDFIPINLPEICVRVVLDLLHLAIFVLLGACVC